MSETASRASATGYLKPKGRAFMIGAIAMLVLLQTGGAFNWPVFNWLVDHRPTLSVNNGCPEGYTCAPVEEAQP